MNYSSSLSMTAHMTHSQKLNLTLALVGVLLLGVADSAAAEETIAILPSDIHLTGAEASQGLVAARLAAAEYVGQARNPLGLPATRRSFKSSKVEQFQPVTAKRRLLCKLTNNRQQPP